jgi:hypothetical protein
MRHWVLAFGWLMSLAGPALATTSAEKAGQELQALRRFRVRPWLGPEEAIAATAMEDARAWQDRYAMLEERLQELIVVEESFIHRDRRYVYEGKPGAIDRKLAAEMERAAADRRMRRWGRRGRYPFPIRFAEAEHWAIDSVTAELYQNEKFRREVCRRVLELADQMDREAELKPRRRK